MRKMMFVLGLALLVVSPAHGADSRQNVPLRRVVLFTSGVGYFEHVGTVEGTAVVELPFRVEQINDLLKSLVVLDFGGGVISAVTYPTRDPLSRVLRSFQVDLAPNPSLADLLKQLRGARVKLWAPSEVSGKVLGVEMRRRDLPQGKGVVVEPILNLFTNEGTIQAVSLLTVQKLQLLDARLAAEINKALAALAAGRSRNRKPLSLLLKGQGQRRVLIGYILETPVWQTSYRLILQKGQKPLLQGWAVVENTTDTDWADVKLTLVSGRPISFIQDLYTPLYVPRPVVKPELYTGLRPPAYEEAEKGAAKPKGKAAKMNFLRRRREHLVAAAAPPPGAVAGRAGGGALRRAAQRALRSVASTATAGELFCYNIENPITLPRQRSAMLPIANVELTGEKVSIYNASVQTKHPLNGFNLKNTSGLNLMAGPVTVFEEGIYAGEARISDLLPGEGRLLSYALDLEMTVDATQSSTTSILQGVQLRSGVLIVRKKITRSRTYAIRNKSADKKVLLIEHPIAAGWALVQPKKPFQKTRSLYRFRVEVPAGGSEKLVVEEEQPQEERLSIRSAGIGQLEYWVKSGRVSPALRKALEGAVELRRQLAHLQGEMRKRRDRIADITRQQERIRRNMTVVSRSSAYYRRLESKLNLQEDELEKLQTEIQKLQAQIEEKQRELDQYLRKLAAD